ncbi:MAG: SAVED domain-containing protein [Candidatus Hodarchaeota archaeon]
MSKREKILEQLKPIVDEFNRSKARFFRDFNDILCGNTPQQLKNYPEILKKDFDRLKAKGVASDHYIYLILALFLVKKHGLMLKKADIDLILSEGHRKLTENNWKKITKELTENSDELIFKSKTGREVYLHFTNIPRISELMNNLVGKALSSEPNHDISIGIFSGDIPEDKDSVDRCFDFSKYFLNQKHHPREKEWNFMKNEIKTFIKDKSHSNKQITMLLKESKAHHSLGFILGNLIYRRNIQLIVYQSEDYWHSQIKRSKVNFNDHWDLLITPNEASFDTEEIYLTLSVAEPIHRFAEKYWRRKKIKPEYSIHLNVKPAPRIDSIKDDKDANVKIEALYSYLTDLKNKIAYTKIHLFIWCPFAFMVMLGMGLAPVVNVQLYEYKKKEGIFYPSFLVERR